MSSPELFRVLLIEDNPGDARLIQEMLAETPDKSFELTHRATTLAAALKIIDGGEVDLVLLDLTLPDSNGVETFSRVRACAARMPVIILSGLDDEKAAIRNVHEGAQDYLVKGHVDSEL